MTSLPRGPRNEWRASLRGLTLIEILLVVSLLSVVVGIGLGMFASLNPGQRAAVGLVQNVLRSAHNSAVARTAPARVRIDSATGTLHAEALRVIGTWHFEDDPVRGAFELDADAFDTDGALLVENGYQGRAVSFAGQPSEARLQIPVHRDPAYDLHAGFAVEFALRLDDFGGGPVLALGRSIAVGLSRSGGIEAFFLAEAKDEAGLPMPGGRVWLRGPAALRPEQWARIGILYDRATFRLLVDGVTVAELGEDAPVWPVEEPLVLGGGQTPFRGSLDNLVISAVADEEGVTLPEGVRFVGETPDEVRFAAGGALDPGRHGGPVEVVLELDDGRRETVRVGLYGTVE